MERYLSRSKQNSADVDEHSSDSEENSCQPSTSKRTYIQKMRKSWLSDPRLCKWIYELNAQEIKCKYCQCILKPKLSTLLMLEKTSKHIVAASPFHKNDQKTIDFLPVSSNFKAKEAEIMEALYVAVHTSIRSVEHLFRLQKNIFSDSKAAVSMTLGRTRCGATIRSVLAPHFQQLLAKDVANNYFSLIIDKSTDISIHKYLGIVIRYYSSYCKKIVCTFLHLSELEDASANGISKAIFEVLLLLLKVSKMVGLGTDNTNVMTGVNRGVIAKLREKNKHIILVPCVCHSLQLSISSASKSLPNEIQYLVSETYNWFSKSSLTQNNYKNIFVQ